MELIKTNLFSVESATNFNLMLMTSKIILCVVCFHLCVIAFVNAQERKHWVLKAGIGYSNQYYNALPRSESSIAILASGDTSYTTSYVGGNNNLRLVGNIMAHYNLITKERFDIDIGIGYRQKGYKEDFFSYRGQLINKNIDVLLHYLSSEISFKFKPIASWYIFLNGRIDALIVAKSSSEHQYIIDNMKTLEISPVIGFGREIAIGNKLLGIIEVEFNRSLTNLSTFPRPNLSNSKTKLWNVSYSINLGIKF